MRASPDDWHLRLFEKSVIKQVKLCALRDFLPPTEVKVCLDLGGDNGVISRLLRAHGGVWHSADLNDDAVESIRSLVGERVSKTVDGAAMPFADWQFDLVAVVDYLEHLRDDRGCVAELRRILRPGGVLVVNVPHLKRRSVSRLLRSLAGLTDEQHGHLRPGYSRQGLESLLGNGFRVTRVSTYSRFFTELVDIAVTRASSASAGGAVHSTKGLLITEAQMKRMEKRFRLYCFAYPCLRLLSKLDALVPFTEGHRLIVRAERA